MEWLKLDRRRPSGLFTLKDAAGIGIPRRDVDRMVHRGQLARVAPGAFVAGDRWRSMSPERRYVLRAQSAMLRLRAPTIVSHHAAAALHGLPLLWPMDSDVAGRRVHLTRRGGGPTRSTPARTIHERYGDAHHGHEQQADDIDAIPVVLPLLAAFGVAEVDGFVAGVVALDAALHQEQTSVEQARDWLQRLRRRPHTATIRRVIDAADGASESPLETQARLVLSALGYRMRLQVRLEDPAGAFVARVDGLVDDLGVVIEVDGRGKYRRDDGHGSVESMLSEKRRESAIRDLGYGIVRLDHALISDPDLVDEHVKAAARRSHPRRRAC